MTIPSCDEKLTSIREQLDNLNTATTDINSIEIHLECAKRQFRETQDIFNKEIIAIPKKQMKHISKARRFYDLKAKELELKKCAQKAAEIFERKKTICEMSKEQLNILHQSLNSNGEIDAEKQYIEVIEQQMELIREAEGECVIAEKNHEIRINDLLQIEGLIRKAVYESGSSIKKSKQYYERREVLTRTLKSQIEIISSLQDKVQKSKDSYNNSMRNLELISEQIHQERSILEDNDFSSNS